MPVLNQEISESLVSRKRDLPASRTWLHVIESGLSAEEARQRKIFNESVFSPAVGDPHLRQKSTGLIAPMPQWIDFIRSEGGEFDENNFEPVVFTGRDWKVAA